MRKFLLLFLVFMICSGSLVTAKAQVTRLQAREAEWKSYALPKTNFKRQVNADKTVVFRVPADWEQRGPLTFKGPHSARLEIVIQKIPEGYPLDDYFASLLQSVKDLTGRAESILTRKTQLQDIEARELFMESPDPEGELIRSTSWVTIHGPAALVFNVQVAVAHAAEIEPFFKAVVQSVMFVGWDYDSHETLRNSTVKTDASSPIDQIESIVETLNDSSAEREAAVDRLTVLFSSTPDVALDLLLDRRPLVRVAIVQAIARANNDALTETLWKFLGDYEPLVTEAAARGLAVRPDIVPRILEHSMSGFNTQMIARVWPFLPKEKRNELLEAIFLKPAVHRPDPPPAKRGGKPRVLTNVIGLSPVKSGKGVVAEFPLMPSRDPNVQLGALALLSDVPREDFKLPLHQLMAAKYDPLVAVGLQVALWRNEALPMAQLLSLVASADKQVSTLAAQSLALAAATADIPRIEALISKDGSKKAVDDELRLTIKKINFRQQLSTAKTAEERIKVVNEALAGPDVSLAQFAWLFHCEAPTEGCAPNPASLKRDVAIKPFAENLFPKRLKHYTAIPNPRQAIQRLNDSLHGLQMDSPRDQSNLVMMLIHLRHVFGAILAAPYQAESLIDYTGIDPDSPITMGAWTAANAHDSNSLAQRRAIVLRVKDRTRFERTVEKVQSVAGSFTHFTNGAAIVTRAAAALPAIIPLSAQLAFAPERDKATKLPTRQLLGYNILADKEWNGIRIRTIEHTWLDSTWSIESATTYIAYLGDLAILAPDLATIRDLLATANGPSDRQLEDNPEFRQTLNSHGQDDVVYFSDLKAVFAEPGAEEKGGSARANERGALRFSSSSWDNSHQFVFDESDWAKPLLPFQPKELAAPRELLPASTIAYFLTKVDLPAFWETSSKDLFSKLEIATVPNFWALDFKKDVLPELGPECGAVFLDAPRTDAFSSATFAAFCKLKSNKLADALKAGKLFTGVGPTVDAAEVKFGEDTAFFATRNGFLVVSNQAKGLSLLDGKTSLATTRDYSRSVEKVPAGVVAFGGYNLEAAVAGVNKEALDGPQKTLASILFSVTSAFHSQNFYATASAGAINAHSSVAMDREGRYPIGDFANLRRGTDITFAIVEPSGRPITNQNHITSLVLRVRGKAPGPIDNIKNDIKTADQVVEQKSATELIVSVSARRAGPDRTIQLPVKDPALAEYLKATPEFAADKKEVMDQARQIAGNDRDAWSVARKLADWTHKNLEWKLVLSADPVLTLATREADCSEFSALFVGMARSLGLPARTVSGLAYNSSSFGGHAWVEVWVGKWIELDPTWGTSFVDATHIRAAGDSLLTSAGLNLLDLEVLEAKRTAADFQKTPRALAEHLAKAIPAADKPELEAATDIALLTDTYMGAGSWSKLSDAEREQMWSAYRRLFTSIMSQYEKKEDNERRIRILHVEEKGDAAEAIGLAEPVEALLRFRFVRSNDAWCLVELTDVDGAFDFASEVFQPAISAVEKTRAGEKTPSVIMTDFGRLSILYRMDSGKAVNRADELLKTKPKDRAVRYVKALALLNVKKTEEGKKLLSELADEGYGPAAYLLPDYLDPKDEKDLQKTVELYQRYTTIEPRDPRGFRELGYAYVDLDQIAEAETAYRKAIELDPAGVYNYGNLIELLVMHDRIAEVRPLLLTGEKYQEDNDLFALIFQDLYSSDAVDALAKFAASERARMKTNMRANYWLGIAYRNEDRFVEAERLFNVAAQLDKKSSDPHVSLAILYRKQSRWLAALKAANYAITLDAEDSEAYYQKACVLAHLGRIKQAMAALTKSVELDDTQVYYIEEEEDLKPLASLPEFKKLIPAKETPAQPEP